MYKIGEWITRFAYLNLLWIFFSIVGLVFFGFFPSTVAMFSVIRKWVLDDDLSQPEIKIFWQAYKKDFLTANMIGISLSVIGYLLYLDYRIIPYDDNWMYIVVRVILLSVTLIYFIIMIFIFPTMAHYNLGAVKLLRNAFIIGFSSPITLILIGLSLLLLYYLFIHLPGLMLFFIGSLESYIIMYLTLRIVRVKSASKEK